MGATGPMGTGHARIIELSKAGYFTNKRFCTKRYNYLPVKDSLQLSILKSVGLVWWDPYFFSPAKLQYLQKDRASLGILPNFIVAKLVLYLFKSIHLKYPGREFWIGLKTLFWLTQQKRYTLRVTMKDFAGQIKMATYLTFKLTENVSKIGI